MIRAVFFDLDDTLCDDAGAWIVCSRKAADYGASLRPEIDPERLARTFLRISEAYWVSLEPTRETREILDVRAAQWNQALQEDLQIDDPTLARTLAHEYGKRRSREIALFPDALATLAELRRRGVCLALITNGLQMTHLEKVAHLGLEEPFDHVLIADAVGFFKPDRRIFEHALALCKCDAQDAVMIGDNLVSDIGGAQAAGIKGFWYNPEGKPRPPDAPAPAGGELGTLRSLLDYLPGEREAAD